MKANMVMEQHIPFYKENFKNDPRWLNKETSHYIFHYFPNSLAEKEIAAIADRQEKAFEKIVSFLRVEPPKRKIKYYLYPDAQTKKELMGDDWYAQSIYKDFCVHILYTEEIKPIGEHEDTHLLSLPWSLSIGLLQEGLAEYSVGHNWHGDSHENTVKEGLKKNILPPISSLMSHDAWMKLPDENILYYYCLAGSFVNFLIEKYGREKFERLYKETNRKKSLEQNKNIFQKIYDFPVEEMEKEWMNNLGAH